MTNVDSIAAFLIRMSSVARAMPPMWQGARISTPLVGPEGQVIGRMLPGKGLYLDCDAKQLGIMRPIPGVYERTAVRRALDFLDDERGAFAKFSDIRSSFTKGLGQRIHVFRGQGADFGAVLMDLFQSTDASGTVNTFSSGVLDQTTPGAMSANLIAPVGSNTAYLLSFGINCQLGGQSKPNGYGYYMVADLLSVTAGLQAFTATTQTVNTATLNRYTSGKGVMCTLEYTTAPNNNIGASISVSYTNQAGISGQTATVISFQGAVGAFAQNTSLSPGIYLASGDYGVQSVQSLTVAAGGTDTVGIFSVLLFYPLLFVTGTAAADDYFEYDLPATLPALVPLATTSGGKLGCLTVMAFSPVNANDAPNGHNMTFAVAQG